MMTPSHLFSERASTEGLQTNRLRSVRARLALLSTLTAELEAEKTARQQGLEVWAVLEIRQVNE